MLEQARALAAAGDDEAAKQAYLALLRQDPANVPALVELAALAEASDHRSAAQTALEQALRLDPANPTSNTALGNLLRKTDDPAAAEPHYRAALAADPNFAPAHQSLGQLLAELGDHRADQHLRAGFTGHAVTTMRHRGNAPGIPLLLLVAAHGGNVPTSQWIDDRRYAVTAICADFFDPNDALPPHAAIVNAIGDADASAQALVTAETIVANATVPIINHPTSVRATDRLTNASRLAAIPGLVTPRILLLSRSDLEAAHVLGFPLLLRSPGYHTGQNFVLVLSEADLAQAAAALPGDNLLAIQYLDASGPDGLARKYRVMFIGGTLYPLHLAVSTDWKVHYYTSGMADRPDLREEERRFLTDMTATLGPRAMHALAAVQTRLALDYAGIDFALSGDGAVLLFEANATMVINPPGPEEIWNYRRPAIAAAIEAAKQMLARATNTERSTPPNLGGITR